jgi:hypothetical protein
MASSDGEKMPPNASEAGAGTRGCSLLCYLVFVLSSMNYSENTQKAPLITTIGDNKLRPRVHLANLALHLLVVVGRLLVLCLITKPGWLAARGPLSHLDKVQPVMWVAASQPARLPMPRRMITRQVGLSAVLLQRQHLR